MDSHDQKLVADWRWILVKSYSMRLAAIASVAVGYAVNHLDTIGAVIALAPPEVRAFVPIPVMVGMFLIIAAARLWKQRK